MKQLKKEKVALLHELYEKGIMDKAIDACDVTKEEVDHFLEYLDEYGNKPIVYLSIHGNASKEMVEGYINQLKSLNCVVRLYEKGTKYDSYNVKNADLVIVFSDVVGGLAVLGRGTETESKIAADHDARLMMALNDYMVADILDIQKTEINAGDKVDWLDTAKITEISIAIELIDIISDLNHDLSVNGRTIYIKPDKKIKTV